MRASIFRLIRLQDLNESKDTERNIYHLCVINSDNPNFIGGKNSSTAEVIVIFRVNVSIVYRIRIDISKTF